MARDGKGKVLVSRFVKTQSAAATVAALSVGSAFLCGGCGSSGGSGTSSSTPQVASNSGGDATLTTSAGRGLGKAQITLQWPDVSTSRLVPSATASIKITLLQNNQPIVGTDRLLVRPASSGSTIGTAHWDNLPLGDLVVQATAYPNANGTGVALAQAFVVTTLKIDQEKTVALTLASTIDHLQITTGELAPATSLAPATLFKGDTLPIAVSAVDKNNAVVLVNHTFQFTSSDSGNAPLISQGSATATLSGNEATVTQITVKETESGKSASVLVPITGFAVVPITAGKAQNAGYAQDTINSKGWVLLNMSNYPTGIAKPPYQDLTLLSPPADSRPRTIVRPYTINNKGQIGGVLGDQEPGGDLLSGAFIQNDINGPASLLPLGKGANGGNKFIAVVSLNDNGLAVLQYAESDFNFVYKRAVLDIASGTITDVPTTVTQNGTELSLTFSQITNGNLLLGGAVSRSSAAPLLLGAVATVGGDARLINPLPGNTTTSVADGNALGQVVGTSSNYVPSFFFGGGVNGSVGELAVPGSGVGRTQDSTGVIPHPFVWTATAGVAALPTPSGFPGGFATGINSSGLIVGSVLSDNGTTVKGTLWLNNRPHDVTAMLTGAQAGFSIRSANRISDTNYITASDASGGTRFVLVPVTSKPGSN